MTPTNRRAFVGAYFVCAVASLVPLWLAKYPPMLDLPQYAAQLSIIKNLKDPAFGFAEIFQVNWFSPYILGMGIARVFCEFFDVLIALKLTVSLSILIWPLAFAAFLKVADGDPWLSLLGFPLAYGHPFYVGLLNFHIAVAAGLLVIALGVSYAKTGAVRRGWQLAGACTLLFFAHASVFLFSLFALAVYLFYAADSAKGKVALVLPLFAPLPVVLLWLTLIPGHGSGGVSWPGTSEVIRRLWTFPGILVDAWPGPSALLSGGVAVCFAVLLIGHYRIRQGRPLLCATAALFIAYLFAPTYFFLDVFISQRLAPFLAVFLMAHVTPIAETRGLWLKRIFIVVAILAWMALLSVRFTIYDREARGVDAVLSAMEPRRRVLGLMFDRVHGPPYSFAFLHFANWYQAYKGGVVRHSFASYGYPQLVSFKNSDDLRFRYYDSLSLHPWTFNRERDVDFDYFMVYSRLDREEQLFGRSSKPPRLLKRSGNWWLYRHIPS